VTAGLDRVADRPREPVHAGVVWNVRQPPGEVLPLLLAEAVAGEVVCGAAGKRAKAVVVELVERGADDAEARRHQAGLGQVEQAGEELAAREVPGRSEEDDHVRVGWRKRDGRRVPRIMRRRHWERTLAQAAAEEARAGRAGAAQIPRAASPRSRSSNA
jgi:hypothetical protein